MNDVYIIVVREQGMTQHPLVFDSKEVRDSEVMWWVEDYKLTQTGPSSYVNAEQGIEVTIWDEPVSTLV